MAAAATEALDDYERALTGRSAGAGSESSETGMLEGGERAPPGGSDVAGAAATGVLEDSERTGTPTGGSRWPGS